MSYKVEPAIWSLELSKSMRWSNDHACFAMFRPLEHVLTFLIIMFFLTSFKTLAGFTYMTPITIGTGYFKIIKSCPVDVQ